MHLKAIRVLLVAPSMSIVGGQSIQAARMLDAFDGHSGVQLRLQPTNPVLPGPFRFLQRIKYLRTGLTELLYAAQLLRGARRHDLLHVFVAGYSSYILTLGPVLLARRLFGSRFILHYHDGRAEDHFRKSPRAVAWSRHASTIVVPSGFLVQVFRQFHLAAQAISNIVNLEALCYRVRDPIAPRFLHNRGLEAHYNVPCTLRAFALIQKAIPAAALVIAHDGPERPALQALARSLHLHNVSFTGAVSELQMRALYDAADIYLMSPSVDNQPLSVLECFASGLPVVATAVGGVPFLVDHQRTGLLVAADDSAAMAKAALRLLREPQLATQLASNAVAELHPYRPGVIARRWEQLYREIAVTPGKLSLPQ